MIKKILLTLALLAVIAYIAIAITQFSNKPKNRICRDIELKYKDSTNTPVITRGEICLQLIQKHLYPVGANMDNIDPLKIEKTLQELPLVEHAECYKTTGDKLGINIHQRTPILRVMNDKGQDFYLDGNDKIMKFNLKCPVNIPIVTGSAEKSYVMRDLYNFGVFLQKDRFWNAQIEQINVLPTKEIELIPLVGAQTIFLGTIYNYDKKLSRLKRFYTEAMNKVGWNKYSRINLEFDNQIICTKKGK